MAAAVRLHVPEALDAGRLDALTRAVQEAMLDDGIRVIVLLGKTDGVFCLGMDFGMVAEGERAVGGATAMARCLHTLRASPKPTVALVDGQALGGGLGLAAACDYVLATERATFGLPELLVGL
ncbi:MAG: enoyl-CoA hydratase/isomerase family protein, partial [Chloroflexi bacterium]|nr:enoyl-CoA hydratase/isomerase family protein [Chloroflexota bacterium]